MQKLSKKYLVFAVIAFIALGMGILNFKPTAPTDKNTILTIGLESSYPPFDFVDEQGNIIGFDVDVAQLIADKLNMKLAVKDMEFEGMILSLKQGKVDLIMSGMNITPSRLKEILMVPYHGETTTHLSLMFWGEIPNGIHKLEDIKGCVSVQSGSVSEAYLSRLPALKVKSFQGALAPLMDVKYGKSTANLVESDVAEYLKGEHPEIIIMNVPLPPEEHIFGFGIGIKKENQALFIQVSKIIQELKESGELKKLEDKWFKDGGHG